MVNYICSICKKNFNHKGDYNRHINRKKKCVPKSSSSLKKNISKNNNQSISSKSGTTVPKNEQLLCKYCEKKFNKKYNLKRHEKTCKLKKYNDSLKEELFELLLNNQKKQKEEYENRINKLQKDLLQLSVKIEKPTINNYYTQNVQNIQILAYEKTDTSHLKDKDYKKILRRGNFCVPNLVDAIHFNPNKPENHNIYIPNMKTGFIMCWNGKSWDIRNREDVIDDIYDDKSNLLIDKIEEWEEIGYKLDPNIMIKFKRFLSKMDDNIVKNKVKEEIRFLLYNKRKLIKNK
jgi:hypothetical protein